MNIAIITNIFPPYHRGGAEQVVKKTVHGLVAQGHKVVVITSTPDKPEVVEQEGYTIHRIHVPNIFFYTDAHDHNAFSRLLWHLIDIFHIGAAKQIRRILQKEKSTVVHTHNLMGLSFLIPKMIRKLGLHHVHTVHDVQLVEPSGIIFKQKEQSWRYNGIHIRLYTALMKRLMGSPDVVISPSLFLQTFYTSRGFFTKSKTVLLRNPLTFAPQKEVVSKGTADEGMIDVLYVGQVEQHKGIHVLLDAWELFQKDMPTDNVGTLHVVGNGSLLPLLQERSKTLPNIHVHGRLTREQIAALLPQIDVTLVPSLCYENSPTVIFESLAFHVPVVASNIEGIAELITEGENGMTFEAGNPAALAEKLCWCLDNKNQLMDMKKSTGNMLDGLSDKEYIAALIGLYQ